MEYLYKIFRQFDQNYFEKKYNERINMESTVKFGLSIKPIKQTNVFELYYIPTNKMIYTVAEIYKMSGQLQISFNKLPPIAKDQFITECLVEELYHTNDLEGVHSTKREIALSVRNVKLKRNENRRFQSMVKSYMDLFEPEKYLPKKPIDIRAIYDDITKEEIAESELPDGIIFRKEITNVLKKSGSGVVIHRGLTPEEKIHTEIEKILNFLNDTEKIPNIIKVAIGHYFFGYIHPFYDGNGRTSRYISSLYLSRSLGDISSLSLSRGCNKWKNQYLDAFEHSNSIMNRGEMNSFIDAFLDIILKTLTDMNAELREKIELINSVLNKINKDMNISGEKHSEFMFVLAQNNFFHYNVGLTVKELSNIMGLSEATIRKIAHELIGKSLIKQQGMRPAYFYIDDEYLEN